MTLKAWFTASVVTALGVLLAPGIPAAAADPTVPGGGWAHAGAVPGAAPPLADAGQPLSANAAAAFSVTGIDVSSHDHTNFPINWASVAASGVSFAYVKATEGTPPDPYVNPYYAADAQAAKANGLYVGAYAFGRPDLGDPAGQANVLVDRSGWLPDTKTLIPMLDLEGPYGTLTQRYDSCWNMAGAISGWIRAFVTQVRARIGRPPLIYASANWWNTCTGSDPSFNTYPLNIAHWTTAPQPTLPAGWADFAFWQTGEGNAAVEGSYDHVVFNGDLGGLAGYAGGSTYMPTVPTRILDTRDGTGAGIVSAIPSGGTVTLQVAGLNGVSASGATAVVVNVTAVGPAFAGYLTVYPDGQARPNASNLNFSAGQTIANLATVPLANGRVNFYNGSPGTVHIIADLTGYYGTNPSGSRYTATGPTRILDTRNGTGTGTTTAVPSGGTVTLQVAGSNGVPATGATAVILNVTATQSASTGFLTVYPDGQARPNVSNLNFTPAQSIAGLATVPLTNGRVDFYNGSPATVHILADLAGYYSTNPAGSRYTPTVPTRILDTRDGTGAGIVSAIPSGGTVTLQVAGLNGVSASGATAVVVNVTAVGPAFAGYLTVYPDGQARPNASNLNFSAGQTIANLATVPLANGRVNFYNGSPGTVHIIADLAGYQY